VLSPQYAEDQYSFEDYHLGGLIKTTNLDQSVQFSDTSNQVFLEEDQWQAELNQNSQEWLFQDFDRIFQLTKEVLGHNQEKYDLFGHSAGGHILHRLALFYQSPLINRILASNASFYTLTDQQTPYPFGLGGTGMSESELRQALSQKLVVFLGALDNEQEQGGTFLRSTSADQQGMHRLARGQYFYATAAENAKASQNEFNWKLHVVPDVGHDQSAMAAAAADYLYHQ
jgi:pimeloyl-ACP methyl ester carboxylesterase